LIIQVDTEAESEACSRNKVGCMHYLECVIKAVQTAQLIS